MKGDTTAGVVFHEPLLLLERGVVGMVLVNGEVNEAAVGQTVVEFLRTVGLDVRRVAVEYNGDVLLKARYGDTKLAAGDCLEIVTFVGGG